MNFREEVKNNPDKFAVQVVGTGHGGEFESLEEALKKYPTLDIEKGCSRFTRAMNGGFSSKFGKPVMRFETWSVYDALSI